MGKFFGTSGARGVTNKEITPELALRVGYEWVLYLAEHYSPTGVLDLTIAHDNRHGAQMLAYAAIAGAQAAGAQVHFIGCASTGVMCSYMKDQGHEGGILITGSHMSPERIGIIPMLGDGRYASASMTDSLEDRMGSAKTPCSCAQWDKVLPVDHSRGSGMAYLTSVARNVDVQSIFPRHFKVLLDPGNGTACLVAKQLFERLGCEVIMVNGTIKPVPDRKAEVRASTCTEAMSLVRTRG